MNCYNEKCYYFDKLMDANCSCGDDTEYAERCLENNYCYFKPADLPNAGASAERISAVMRRTAEGEGRVSRKHHYLKTETEYFQLQEKGEKTFEVRRNDRDFKKHDMVHLEEVVNGQYTGRTLPFKEIVYVLHGGQFGIEEGYCVLQLK